MGVLESTVNSGVWSIDSLDCFSVVRLSGSWMWWFFMFNRSFRGVLLFETVLGWGMLGFSTKRLLKLLGDYLKKGQFLRISLFM